MNQSLRTHLVRLTAVLALAGAVLTTAGPPATGQSDPPTRVLLSPRWPHCGACPDK